MTLWGLITPEVMQMGSLLLYQFPGCSFPFPQSVHTISISQCKKGVTRVHSECTIWYPVLPIWNVSDDLEPNLYPAVSSSYATVMTAFFVIVTHQLRCEIHVNRHRVSSLNETLLQRVHCSGNLFIYFFCLRVCLLTIIMLCLVLYNFIHS